ncbi:MAG: hypothetical protein ACLT1J_14395 [Mediterraneibacter gnavus]
MIDGILFEDIRMDSVLTPFVINCFYFCDPDGHSEYVQCKEPLAVDERTPQIKELCFRNIQARKLSCGSCVFLRSPGAEN